MRSLPTLCALFCTAILSHSVSAATQSDALKQEAAALIPPFAQQLMDTVQKAKEDGGPSAAIDACQDLAPKIADQHSTDQWKIGRTSLKTRSDANIPDDWERGVLEQFAERAAKGEDAKTMSYAETVDGQFRLMKAIPLQEGCLGCHGNGIKPEIAAALDAKYPNDQARGYSVGDIRGAFTLRYLGEKQ
ncbi:Tll0287-like domain-containing protein [Denitrificimonas caeni]|uniref:Tll0287-like domain-containing protein n=1 Tax=Denitrificimonas caeni TaxID=521720 RepID=UPI001962F89D|nr:DUF3365 domain-containing protein [Denitrificimonas caeni]